MDTDTDQQDGTSLQSHAISQY